MTKLFNSNLYHINKLYTLYQHITTKWILMRDFGKQLLSNVRAFRHEKLFLSTCSTSYLIYIYIYIYAGLPNIYAVHTAKYLISITLIKVKDCVYCTFV